MIFYRKHRISIGNFGFLSETYNFYLIESSKIVYFHREMFHLHRQTCPTPQRIITDFLSETSNFDRKRWFSIGNIEFLSGCNNTFSSGIVSFVSTNISDTTENNYRFSVGNVEFLSETLVFYRKHRISIGLNHQK